MIFSFTTAFQKVDHLLYLFELWDLFACWKTYLYRIWRSSLGFWLCDGNGESRLHLWKLKALKFLMHTLQLVLHTDVTDIYSIALARVLSGCCQKFQQEGRSSCWKLSICFKIQSRKTKRQLICVHENDLFSYLALCVCACAHVCVCVCVCVCMCA